MAASVLGIVSERGLKCRVIDRHAIEDAEFQIKLSNALAHIIIVIAII